MSDIDPIAAIERRGFKAAASEIQELGALSIGAEKLRGTIGTVYLRALVKSAQDYRDRSATDTEAVRSAHEFLYPHVLVGVTTPDVAPAAATSAADRKNRALERNRRSNFARTAEHTLRKWVESGGRLSDLSPAEVTKASLMMGTPPAPAPTPITGGSATVSAQFVNTIAIARVHLARMNRALQRLQPTNDDETRAIDTFCREVIDSLMHRISTP